jgi:integrase
MRRPAFRSLIRRRTSASRAVTLRWAKRRNLRVVSSANQRCTRFSRDGWQHTGLVFTSHRGAALDAGNARKMFKRICTEAGAGDGWTPRELRTTFVSLLSHQGVSIEEIARLAGHASTRTTEIVYRRELRPVITTGAEIMDELFTGN